ncbi:MAG TPA: amino acid adenylation domain-containing protein [Ktedonobacteraceae bacterium]
MDHIEDIYELSPTQQGMLFHTLYAPEAGVYWLQVHCTVRGNLDIPLFQQAWQRVVNQHPALRSIIYWEDLETPMQVVLREVQLPWQLLDWREVSPDEQPERLQQYLRMDSRQSIDFTQGPLMRLALIQEADDLYRLVWSYHHLLLDGWSMFHIFEEVFACYEAYQQGQAFRPRYRHPYRDYIAWLQEQDAGQAETFWRQELAGVRSATPLGVGRGAEEVSAQLLKYRRQQIFCSAEMTNALRTLARQQQLTLNTLIQGAWALLLSRYSGQDDVLFGATLAGRPAALPEVEAMIGMFINTLPVRIQVPASVPLLSWLQQLQIQQAEMRQYEYSSLVKVQGWSEAPRDTPLFESIVVFENYPVNDALQKRPGGLEIGQIHALEWTGYPLVFAAAPTSELMLQINYDTRRFTEDTTWRMLGQVRTLLENFIAHPEQRLSEVMLLPEAEHQLLITAWNATRVAHQHAMSLHQQFEEQAAKTPDVVAVQYEDQFLTYQELNRRANQLAHYLRVLGIKADVPVGVCVERSLELIIGLLGTLKAGGAYVPLDVSQPLERLAFILQDASIPVLLTTQDILPALHETTPRVVYLDKDWPAIARESEEQAQSIIAAENLAYVIYTSGSTGRPKGVMLTHHAICNHTVWMRDYFPFTVGDRLLQKTAISFDASVWEFCCALLTGVTLVMARPGGQRDSKYMVEILHREYISILLIVPSHLQILLDEPGWQKCTSLRYLGCGGEDLPAVLSQRLAAFPHPALLYNLYGPTETTVETICWVGKPESVTGEKVPIGQPVFNTQVYVLDHHFRPVPIGVTGELYIGGDALARGYLKRADLTAEQFVPNPFNQETGTRLYRTGDLARYRPDGTLEYLGRKDNQVKLRGYRIEIGEIEAILGQHPLVQQCAIIVREDIPGDRRLVAYIVPHSEEAPTASSLRATLQAKLPSYMVPSTFVIQTSLPRSSSEKIDRHALPRPESINLESEATYVAPQSELEQAIATAWQEALHIEKVGIHDNFFDLGGHSLLLVRVQSSLHQTLNQEIPLMDMFKHTTINALARHLSQPQDAQPDLHDLQHSYDRGETRRTAMQRHRKHKQGMREQQEQGESDE